MRKNSFLVLLLFLIIITGCVINYTKDDGNELMRSYIKLQESIIDQEAGQAFPTSESEELHDDLEELTRQIESEDSQFFQENLKRVPHEVPNPKDRVSESQIRITKSQVVLGVRDVSWGYMADTNSMDPVLDTGSTVLTIKPKSADEIEVGDIIVFNDHVNSIPTIHRVVQKENDEQGIYFITKGDNNPERDPYNVRFEDILSVIIGVIY